MKIKQKGGLKIATFKSDIMIPQARTLFPLGKICGWLFSVFRLVSPGDTDCAH